MEKIFLFLLAKIAATLAWAHVSERAILGNIATDLDAISTDLNSLTATVNAYAGGVLDGLTVMKSERFLIRDLESSTTNADNLGELSEPDAHDTLDSVKGLVPDIEDTLDAIASKQPQLKAAKMDGQAVAHLQKLQGLVERYGNSLVAHMPEREVDQWKGMLARITDMFSNTISQFQ